ncbi:FAD-dependent oxidoreductase [Anaeromyxobacter dehalogenans]|uniref:FAD-dependent pyridine nucleotide-disulfide oxidoreductase n=1 Tax=Anaeromyxobacter dehalogenans (strain 2CP-C) TaxID=290397 RepID=Q2IEQ8_ANADE|nr:FAD-dependent oxidoreductase [Anaeromyxobacter dehalogenans]ABC83063.1 FAD-dependent pyridine nucleotide-disulfide oxidoreductase [Anaeromyxobacter dehalogenans 2CP-C]
MRVAIIGSGPAGFYAAEALLKRTDTAVDVDMFDRLPTPFGLVRGGVAPDHQRIKAVTRVFASTAARPTFRFLGNVRLGRDVTVDDLRRHYHQIVYATGSESDRRLGIPGEGIERCTPATVFVGWYNGHPDYRHARFDLSVRRAAVVGNGNVAVDVARILLRTRAELERTDIAAHALEALRESQVREVYLLGRRGPAQAAFSPAELRELGTLEAADPVVDPADLAGLSDPAPGGNLEILRSFAARRPRPDARRLHLRFLVSPTEVLADAAGAVAGLRLEKNRLERRPDGTVVARGTGETEVLEVGLVLPAVGYAADRIPGVPFDEKARVIANEDGRVVDPVLRSPLPGEYVVGWARSGPQGLIGEHRRASAHVVAHMVADAAGLATRPLPPRDAIDDVLRARGVRPVSFVDWARLDEVEVARGARRGAPRDKLVDVAAMLAILGEGE